mmetsp:Transcript_9138/g.38444  ORF Transcript_9138/g.38444 Transcript_9138/m.38444 type:complete len:232 (-) Transcript_9138:1839-2534(-)
MILQERAERQKQLRRCGVRLHSSLVHITRGFNIQSGDFQICPRLVQKRPRLCRSSDAFDSGLKPRARGFDTLDASFKLTPLKPHERIRGVRRGRAREQSARGGVSPVAFLERSPQTQVRAPLEIRRRESAPRRFAVGVFFGGAFVFAGAIARNLSRYIIPLAPVAVHRGDRRADRVTVFGFERSVKDRVERAQLVRAGGRERRAAREEPPRASGVASARRLRRRAREAGQV